MVTLPGIPQVATNYIRSATKAGMRGQVHIVTPGQPVYSPSTGYAVGTVGPTPGYSGPANIHPATGSGEQDMDGGMVEVNSISVTLPIDATPMPMLEDHVVIDLCDDQTLNGESLRIVGISNGGSMAVVRTLTCTFVQSNPFNPSA